VSKKILPSSSDPDLLTERRQLFLPAARFHIDYTFIAMISRNNAVDADASEAADGACRSQRLWSSLFAIAASQTGFPISCISVHGISQKAPSISRFSDLDEIAGNGELFVQGFATWAVGSTKCDLRSKVSERRKIVIASSRTTFCDLSTQYVSGWDGIEGLGNTDEEQGNYLFAFVLIWCYTFSSRLIEIRGISNQDRVVYIDCNTQEQGCKESFDIPIGHASEAQQRWWNALFSNGYTWQARMHRSGHDYFPPWSCQLYPEQRRFKTRATHFTCYLLKP
jgi:hypothetical protein